MSIDKYFWDQNKAALQETRRALRDPNHPRYLERMVALLSRCDKPKELFTLIPKKTFIDNWPRIRAGWLKRARQSEHRDWWETLYEQMVQSVPSSPVGRPAEPFRKVGIALKERRLALGLSQKQLATQTQLNQPLVSQIEEGKKNITLLTLLRLCKVLKINSLEVL